MNEISNLTLFLIGLAIGGGVAILGGLVDYALHLRRNREPRFGVPGCLVYTVGGLILAGVVAIIVSFMTTGGPLPALVMGAGVIAGFYAGFILMVVAWLVRDNARTAPETRVPSDPTLP